MAKTPSYLIAADGLPARVSGAWARDKLYYVERYFTIFNKGMYKKWPRRFYVDLMAGPGRCITAERDEFDGSPLLAVRSEPAFERCIFVESAPTLLDALRIRSEEYLERASILPGDCNDVGTINSIRNALPNSALGIAFVDNLGLDVTFASLDALTNGRKIDLLITLQVSDLTRNADNALDGDQEQRFDDFFWGGGMARRYSAVQDREPNSARNRDRIDSVLHRAAWFNRLPAYGRVARSNEEHEECAFVSARLGGAA